MKGENEADAVLVLDEPWVPDRSRLGSLAVLRGSEPVLRYADGIDLEVVVLDPRDYRSAAQAIDAAARHRRGQVALVAGPVPVEWRAELRAAAVSFLARTGAAEIRWPRIVVSAHRFEDEDDHRRSPVPLQKSRAIVAQELLARGPAQPVTITELATNAEVSPATASRAVHQLAEQGLVERRRAGRAVAVSVAAPRALLRRLAERTPWPAADTIAGYRWGRTAADIATGVCEEADASGVDVAVSGRAAAEAYGVLATRSAREVRLWVATQMSADDLVRALGAEHVPQEEANLFIAFDRRGYGLHRSERLGILRLAHPVRVYCDLQDEPRGPDLADDLWRSTGGW